MVPVENCRQRQSRDKLLLAMKVTPAQPEAPAGSINILKAAVTMRAYAVLG